MVVFLSPIITVYGVIMSEKQKNKKEKLCHQFDVAKKNRPVFNFFSKILFKHIFGVNEESLIEDIPEKAIIVSIHAAKRGPMSISVSHPKYCAMWGHHGMLGNYRERFSYLRNVLYIQKMHKGKFISTLKATYEAAFSIYIYKGMRVIGTYTDMRLLQTIRNSMDALDAGASVVIFPEDSSEGYFDEVKTAFSGFVILSSVYYKKCGEDVPVIPAYISPKKKRFILGEPRYVREMEREGMDKQQIADRIKDDINELYHKYILTDLKAEPTVKNAPVRNKEYYGE